MKKDKEKKNKKKKVEAIKLNKLNIWINISCGICILFFIINNVLLYFSNSYAYFFVKNISNNINGIFYFLNGHIDYFSIILMLIFFVIVFINIGVDIYYENISKRSYEARTKIVNVFYTIFVVTTMLIIFPSYFSQFSNHLPNFDELYFKSTKNKTYDVEELIELDKYLQKKVLDMADSIKRNENNEIETHIDYNKQAVRNLKNISNDIELLQGLYPTKSSKINNTIRGILGSKVVGFTTPYNTYFDYNATSTSIINTITHEFCHTKGILRESETVYCAFLAGVKSDDELSNYAAYIEAFSWVSEATLELSPEISDRLEDEVLSKCLTNDYKELCEVYTKNNEDYIKGSKFIRITSYRLKNYKNHIDELKNSLTILKNNGAELIVNKEIKEIDEIINLVLEESEARVIIKADIDNKKFSLIKDSIKDKRLYLSIYQENKKEEKSSTRENDPTKYYLGPLKDKDEHVILNLNYGSVEHDYSRVARFLLEHYEKEGYN